MEKTFDDNMTSVIRSMENGYLNNGMFNKIYPFTTENISGYYNKFTLNNKSLLTVGSSSDQALNAVLNGASNVTVVDLCPYTKYYYYLKKAALMSLNREEFIEFFASTLNKNNINKRMFNKESFDKISNNLKSLNFEAYMFWEELFKNYDVFDVRKVLFNSDEHTPKELKSMSPYLYNECAYRELRSRIEKSYINFITSDVFNSNIKEKYDSIWLSNISQYNTLEHLLEAYQKLIDNNLNDDGLLMLSYIYEISNQVIANGNYDIYNIKKYEEAFNEYIICVDRFESVKSIGGEVTGSEDATVTFVKRKKNRII